MQRKPAPAKKQSASTHSATPPRWKIWCVRTQTTGTGSTDAGKPARKESQGSTRIGSADPDLLLIPTSTCPRRGRRAPRATRLAAGEVRRHATATALRLAATSFRFVRPPVSVRLFPFPSISPEYRITLARSFAERERRPRRG